MIAEKYFRLKTSIGGNREKTKYEWTFGVPIEEQLHITGPGRAVLRLLAELGFAMRLSEEMGGCYDEPLERTLDTLLAAVEAQGALTKQDCSYAEDCLAPMEQPAKSYRLILAAHAHIDMNWMWGYEETVAAVLATFQSILNIMDEYPQFCFSQSQAAVYKIVEEHDPDMMEKIKRRIAEGRWEVTATAWVETDKNMPTGESLLRHIQDTRSYLSRTWGVKDFDIDFSPDTFGHSANIPEIDCFGDVKYCYHCRGNERDMVLSRYRAPSGKEILVCREPYWYNSGISPEIADGLFEVSHRSGGLKTGLIVYGVGDHGGGPTRRDVERALEMQNWKIFPQIVFGGFRQFFQEAESVRAKLPVVTEEMNFIFSGCYSTQSRIKRGNRRAETALLETESIAAIARKADYQLDRERMCRAWEDVLFTHFHDIITGSCVQSSREYAMSLYQRAQAMAGSQMRKALECISEQIDTSSVKTDSDIGSSQSEGAGAGYGMEAYVGVPSTERGAGKTRIFHVFNTLSYPRRKIVQLTVWDWVGDPRLLEAKDCHGNSVALQLLDQEPQTYWEHRYFRVLVDVDLPAAGYTTIVLSPKILKTYPVYRNRITGDRIGTQYEDYILKNENIEVRISGKTGRILSLFDRNRGEEKIGGSQSAGFTWMEAECRTGNAWNIGRIFREEPVCRCIGLEGQEGELQSCVKAKFTVESSGIEVVYLLEKHASCLEIKATADWNEVQKTSIPVLDFRAPLSYRTEKYQYDIPMGSIERKNVGCDVPGLKYGMAVNPDGSSLALICDSRYGYRGYGDSIGVTIFNSSNYPDPYPERGIHEFSLWLGISGGGAAETERLAEDCVSRPICQSSNSHRGRLPMEDSLLAVESDSAVITAILPSGDGSILLRGYESAGKRSDMKIRLPADIPNAMLVDLYERPRRKLTVDNGRVSVPLEPYSVFELKLSGEEKT